MKVLSTFDKSATEILGEKVKVRLNFKVGAQEPYAPVTQLIFILLKGNLDTYRLCDDVWTFVIKDVNFKLDNQSNVQAEKIKIVSCNSKRPGEFWDGVEGAASGVRTCPDAAHHAGDNERLRERHFFSIQGLTYGAKGEWDLYWSLGKIPREFYEGERPFAFVQVTIQSCQSPCPFVTAQ